MAGAAALRGHRRSAEGAGWCAETERAYGGLPKWAPQAAEKPARELQPWHQRGGAVLRPRADHGLDAAPTRAEMAVEPVYIVEEVSSGCQSGLSEESARTRAPINFSLLNSKF